MTSAVEPLRYPQFRWLWAGNVFSASGTFVQTVAASWLMFELTGSGAWVGLIVASVVNLFWMNDTFSLAIAAIGVLIFAGLTAYDTQKIKSMYFAVAGTDFHGKATIMGALTLYLDFINLFSFLLSFLGNRE